MFSKKGKDRKHSNNKENTVTKFYFTNPNKVSFLQERSSINGIRIRQDCRLKKQIYDFYEVDWEIVLYAFWMHFKTLDSSILQCSMLASGHLQITHRNQDRNKTSMLNK